MRWKKTFALGFLAITVISCSKKQANNQDVNIPIVFPSPSPSVSPSPSPSPSPTPSTGPIPVTTHPILRSAHDGAVSRPSGQFCSQAGQYSGTSSAVYNYGYIYNSTSRSCDQVIMHNGLSFTPFNTSGACSAAVSSGSCLSWDPMESGCLIYKGTTDIAAGCSKSVGVTGSGVIAGRVCKSSGCVYKNLGNYPVSIVTVSLFAQGSRDGLVKFSTGPGLVSCMAATSVTTTRSALGGSLLLNSDAPPCGESRTNTSPYAATLAAALDDLMTFYANQLSCN